MRERLRHWGIPHYVLLGLCIALVLTVGLAASTSSSPFGSYNPQWDGTSDLRQYTADRGATPAIVTTTADYPQTATNGTLAVVLGPDESYTAAETARIRRFVTAGGTLLVAEDYGSVGNDLLATLGAQARFDGRPLRDERQYYRSLRLPVATNATATSISDGDTQLTLNYGTAIDPNGATVALSTSDYAYLDANRNEQLDSTEQLTSYPVVTIESVGAGRVIVVSDPSVFINDMFERPGNQAFVQTLLRGTNADRVLFDRSHSAQPPLLTQLYLFLQDTPGAQALLVFVIGGLLIAWVRADGWYDSWRDDADEQHTAVSSEALAAYLYDRHPDWDESRIQRMIAGVMSTRPLEKDDD